MDIYGFEYYSSAISETLKKNPTSYIDILLENDPTLTASDVLKLIIGLQKNWSLYYGHNVQLGIIVDKLSDEVCLDQIIDYNFNDDIKSIIQDGNYNHVTYIVQKSGLITQKNYCKSKLSSVAISGISYQKKTIAFYLGNSGIDVYIHGVAFELENHLDSYSDMIFIKQCSIIEYKKLLKDFFIECVQYDPFNHYFIIKDRLSRSQHSLLDKYPKALCSKPEKIFQNDLVYFLKTHCKDSILKEAMNKNEERYDVWVLTDEKKLFVFELKWLGISITVDGSIFKEYNCSDRAISGAYQLKDYIDNAEMYSQLGADMKIHCGILVVFDAREQMDNIEYLKFFKQSITSEI